MILYLVTIIELIRSQQLSVHSVGLLEHGVHVFFRQVGRLVRTSHQVTHRHIVIVAHH